MLSIRFVIILLSLVPSVYTDIGNFSPNFYQSLFPENQPIGTTVLQLHLQTYNSSPESVSLEGRLHSHFLLTSDLVILSATVLDRETTAHYQLTAVALYNNSEIATANVSISIEDVNDNAPYCNASYYTIEVNENYLADSLLAVQCWDRDVGINASLLYQLQNNYSTFSIGSTGNLGLSQSLDYEQYPDGILLQLMVSDQGDAPLSSHVYVFVAILSVNEFAPQFSDTTMIQSISEHTKPGSQIVKITASDMDSGRGGDVFYFLSSVPEEGLFHLDLYSGALYILRSLDYETTTAYSLLVTASNSPVAGTADSLNTSAVLELTILDIVEDLRFENDLMLTTVSEDVLSGSQIAILTCVTSSASSTDITYSFASAAATVSHIFSIDATSGAVKTRSALNYENQSSYEVPVSCSCCSSPSLRAHISLFVSLSDVNEFPPVFSPSEYQVVLGEQTGPGTTVLQLSATDRDSGSYGLVQYRLLSHEQMFYLHPNTGILYLRGTLSYDTESSYNITVLAGNSYPPSPSDTLSNTATVRVVVTEYFLDKPPDCTNETKLLTLEESTPIHQPLTQFSCNNNDSTGLNYTLDSNYSSSPFYVYSNGTLSLQDYLDFEFGSRFYLLEIRATQTHSPFYSSPIFLHVIVTPVNEYIPVFNKTHYSLSISELTAVGSNILNVSANDEDSYPDGGARFTFIAESDTFSVDPISGYVYLVSPLDYDVTSQYNLSLVATDLSSRPLSSTAVLLIEVTNENTLPPSCYPTRVHATLLESTAPQSEVAQFSCSDPDGLLVPSDLLTSLSPQIDNILTIINGSIVLTSQLDYELITAYTGVLLVTEPNSSFSFQIAISILVEPCNEFAPHFNNLPATISINSSDVWTLYPVFSVTANDLDAGVDGEVEFYLQDSYQEVFQIDSYTGDLWLVYPVQQILNDSINLTVIARDQSMINSLANSSTTYININRDTPPSCQSYFHSFSVPENTSTNSVLLRLSCLSPVSYTLSDEVFSEQFRITPNGSLLLALSLDAETNSSYFSSVRVLFSHNRTLTVGISISVEDVNEFAPSFISPPSYYELRAGIELGSLLLAFIAIDTDLHNQIEYSLAYVILGLYLSPHTGQLFLSSREIFSLSSPLSISITATDSDPYPMNSTTELMLNVSVSSLITLSPTQPIFLFSVREDELVSSVVGTVHCTNAGNLSYELQHSASSNYTFSLNRETGELVLNKSLSYEKNQSYALEMTCTSKNINMSAQFITVVSIKDINEYPPTIQPAYYEVYLNESTKVGERLHTISAYDPDNPSTQLSYSMVQPLQASLFTVSYLTGEIYLIRELDYELQASYGLNITVYDGEPSDVDTKSSQFLLTVIVIDINDNSPVCPHVLTLHSTQNNASRELVAALNCSDKDSVAITNLRYFGVDTLHEDYFELTTQGDPPTWYLYFLPLEAGASHNGSLFNAYFHNIKCCDGSRPELCTEMLVLVTTVDKPVPQVGLNATQLALAINTEGLENIITLFLNISHANWVAVVEHFKLLTANILTSYCITNPFRCSIQEDCSSQRQSDWFDVNNVVIQDGYPVSTGDGTQLEIHFYVSLPDLPKDPEGATDYVVPGEVLYEIVSNKSDIFNSILSAIAPASNCQNSKELLIYILATFITGVLFSMALLILGYLICKLSECCKDNAHKVTSRKRVFPDESERLRVSSIDYEIELRSMSAGGIQERQPDNNMYINPTTSLNSGMSMGQVDVVKVSADSGEIEIDPNQNELLKIKFNEEKKKGKPPENSTSMNPFWETNPRFWNFQDEAVEKAEYCVTPLLSEVSASVRDTDSPITEYYSTDVSVFTSQTSLGQASTKALGKARGRYDLMELASMESLMEQNSANKPKTSLRPESQNLVSSQTTSRSTVLYLPSTPSTASNTSLQELPKCSTAINIDSQVCNKPSGQNLAPKKAWELD